MIDYEYVSTLVSTSFPNTYMITSCLCDFCAYDLTDLTGFGQRQSRAL